MSEIRLKTYNGGMQGSFLFPKNLRWIFCQIYWSGNKELFIFGE